MTAFTGTRRTNLCPLCPVESCNASALSAFPVSRPMASGANWSLARHVSSDFQKPSLQKQLLHFLKLRARNAAFILGPDHLQWFRIVLDKLRPRQQASLACLRLEIHGTLPFLLSSQLSGVAFPLGQVPCILAYLMEQCQRSEVHANAHEPNMKNDAPLTLLTNLHQISWRGLGPSMPPRTGARLWGSLCRLSARPRPHQSG